MKHGNEGTDGEEHASPEVQHPKGVPVSIDRARPRGVSKISGVPHGAPQTRARGKDSGHEEGKLVVFSRTMYEVRIVGCHSQVSVCVSG